MRSNNKKNLRIFIIAGEVSGDVLGAKIMREMPDAQFVGIGGNDMRGAGLKPIFPISDLAVMGITEVLANAKTLLARIDETVDAIYKFEPDVVLTIDSPSFAKRVIAKIKKRMNSPLGRGGTRSVTGWVPKFYHVVAPQVWAWRPKRAKKFAKLFDKLYSFFDFEVPYFTKYGLDTIAVGHPIADGLKSIPESVSVKNKTIALIPGSRISEVKKLLPLMRDAAEQIAAANPKRFDFVIPVVETTKDFIRSEIRSWAVKPKLVPSKDRYDMYAKTYIAIAASGTVSAELAIMHIPTIVVYKMNKLTMAMARLLVKIKWVSLVNILLKKTVYPELLGADASVDNILREFNKLSDGDTRHEMISELSNADKLWQPGRTSAAKIIARDIVF